MDDEFKLFVIWWEHQVHTYPGGNGVDGGVYQGLKRARIQNTEFKNKGLEPTKVIEWKPINSSENK